MNAVLTIEPSAADPYDPRNRLAFADAFRTVAILAVVCDHLIRRVTVSSALVKTADVLGILGVDCFFVLTGFLLASPYIEAIVGERPYPSSKLFYARRFLRIWPLYSVAVLVSALGERIHGGHPVSVGDIVAHLSMTHNFFPNYYLGKFNIPLWTMAVDADFYLLLPPVALGAMLFAAKLRPDRRMTLVFSSCALYFVGSLVYRIVFVHEFPALVSSEDGMFIFLRNVIGLGGSFSFGIAIAACETALLKIPGRITYCFLGVGLLAAGILFVESLIGGSSDDGAFRIPLIQATFDHVGAVAAGALLLAGLHGSRSFVVKLTRAKLIIFLSTLSYAIYLFHDPILNALFNLLGGHRHVLHPSLRYGVELTLGTVVATLGVAYGAHRLIEQPFLRWKDALRERAA